MDVQLCTFFEFAVHDIPKDVALFEKHSSITVDMPTVWSHVASGL